MSIWAVFYLGSIVLHALLVTRLARGRLEQQLANVVVLVTLIGMVCGAHALYYIVVERTLTNAYLADAYADLAHYRATPVDAAWLWEASGELRATSGGFWGGPWLAVMGLLPFAVGLRRTLNTKHAFLDVAAISLPWALALAKVGCFAHGCCHGVEGTGPLFIRATWVSPETGCYMRSCFPTQLLDVAIYLLVGGALLWLWRRGRQTGRLLLWFVLLVGMGRFLSEFTRGDNVGGKIIGLSPVQIVVAAGSVTALALLRWPRLYDWTLALRDTASGNLEPELNDEGARRQDRLVPWLAIVILIACYLILPALPLVLLIVLFAVRLATALRGGDSPVAWSRAATALAYASVEVSFVTAFLIPNLIWFILSLGVLTAAAVAILNRAAEHH